MEFDLIIANPPYGSSGANIVKFIIDNIEFKEFINLLPANDYKRNKERDLFNYQSDMISLNNAFTDAAVTTHLAKIYKNKVNDLTKEEFEIYNYLDKSLDKYFQANLRREHYAIDNSVYKPKIKNFEESFNLKKCLFIGKRYIADEHFPYTKNCAGYKVNKERNISFNELLAISSKAEQKNGNVGDFSLVQFNTEEEQINITDFLYSDEGFKFMTKILTCMNADSYCNVSRFLPKVDWTKEQTVESILNEYNYTEKEIEEILKDLNNYKGQDN